MGGDIMVRGNAAEKKQGLVECYLLLSFVMRLNQGFRHAAENDGKYEIFSRLIGHPITQYSNDASGKI